MTEGREKPRRQVTLWTAWIGMSQLLSIIGLASIVDDLRIWIRFIAWLLDRLRELMAPLAELLVAAGGAIHAVIDLFRGFFRPILDFLLQWLPFSTPDLVKDMIVVAAFLALGLRRADRSHEDLWKQAMRDESQRLYLSFRQAGIDLDPDDALDVMVAIACYRDLTRPPPRYFKRGRARADRVCEHVWHAALARYGPELQAFADAKQNEPIISDETGDVVFGHISSRFIVWLLAWVTAILVALDLWLTK